jgi:gamma-glutamylcysteine synthetase
MTEPTEWRKEDQMPRKRPVNGTVQLNVWISVEAKQYLDERFEREGHHLYEQIEDYIRKDMAAHRGELVEQQSLPVISELVDTTLRKYTAQLRTDIREDMQLEIIEQIKTITRNSDNRLASLIVRAVRDSGIIRRLLYALVAKTHGAAFAAEAYESAREKAGQELTSRITAKKEAD